MTELLDVKIESLCGYLGLAIVVPLCIRVLIHMIEAYRLNIPFFKIFKGCGGRHSGRRIPADYWTGFIIGVLEMLAYPALMAVDMPTAIGGWLVFKTVNRWRYAPNQPRGPFNRYLLANALILFAAYFSVRLAF